MEICALNLDSALAGEAGAELRWRASWTNGDAVLAALGGS